MKKSIKFIAAVAITACLASSASAASYGFNIGAIQDSIGNAVEQETKRNPDWFADLLSQIIARLH